LLQDWKASPNPKTIINNIPNFFILFLLIPDKSNKSSGNFSHVFDVLY
jgi:hypothetical protein